MTNAAFKLAALLESWRGGQGVPVNMRGGAHPGSSSFWREQAEAAALVRELQDAVTSLEATEYATWEPYIAEWYRGVFSFHSPWNAQGNVVTSTDESLSMLRALGTILQYAKPPHPALTAVQREDLLGAVQDAVELVKDPDGSLSDAERFYVLQLLTATRSLLDETEINDRVDIQTHIDQLMGALARLSAQFTETGDEERGNKFRQVFVRIYKAARQLADDGTSAAALVTGTADAVKAITGG